MRWLSACLSSQEAAPDAVEAGDILIMENQMEKTMMQLKPGFCRDVTVMITEISCWSAG